MHGKNPALINQLIRFRENPDRISNFVYSIDNMLVTPFTQIDQLDSPDDRPLPATTEPKKKGFRDFFRFGQRNLNSVSSYTPRGYPITKLDKMIEYHFMIPEDIASKKEQLEGLKWYELIKRSKLSNEISQLESKKEQYRKDVLKFTPYQGDGSYSLLTDSLAAPTPNDLQTWWENFYITYENDMCTYVREAGMPQMRPNLTRPEKIEAYRQCMEEYIGSISTVDENMVRLSRDVQGNLDLTKFVFCQDHRNQSLVEILSGIRDVMEDGHLVNNGLKKYRTTNIFGVDKFMRNTSKGSEIPAQMGELEQAFIGLSGIEDTESYIESSIDIFTRFLQVHPYSDGNGRTSRALLDIMLINKGIVPPVLYDTYFDRGVLDENVTKYLAGDKDALYSFIKQRIKSAPENFTPAQDKGENAVRQENDAVSLE